MQNFRDLKIFDWIDSDTLNNIILTSKVKNYSKWSIVIRQWDISNGEWYIIKYWKVEVLINWKKVKELWEWEIFGEIALLSEDERSASVIANSDIELIVITQDSILELINNWNESINKNIMERIEENIKNSY